MLDFAAPAAPEPTLAMDRTRAGSAAQRPLSVAIYMHDLSGGGVERQCLALAGALAARGLEVTLVLHRLHGELLPSLPSRLRVVDLASRRTLADIPRLARYLRRERPDILLANIDHNNVAALLANTAARVGTQVVICQHNALTGFAEAERWTYRLIPLSYRLLAPVAGAVVAVSQGIAQELRHGIGIPDRKIRTIHNAAIGEGFDARAGEPVAHPWFDDRSAPVFVTVGRLVAQKDHETLLRALAIHQRHAPARLLVLGVGPLRARLEALAHTLDIADSVDFLGFRENPLPYVRRADAFILASVSEGFGNVLVEAMGCGTPVIATDCPHGPAEILDHGRYGILVPPREPTALAEALAQARSLRARWPAEVLTARAAAFSDAACAARYHALFRELAGSLAGGP